MRAALDDSLKATTNPDQLDHLKAMQAAFESYDGQLAELIKTRNEIKRLTAEELDPLGELLAFRGITPSEIKTALRRRPGDAAVSADL